MNNWYVEYRSTPKRDGKPKLVSLDKIDVYQGFRSVYAYDEATKDLILSQGHFRDLGQLPVFSDTLFIDFDDQDDAVVKFVDFLTEHNYGYSAYDSGNRSIHFHIPISPMEGAMVPAYQKNWVKKHAPLADLSFYTHTGQFRLDGTLHRKTYKFKKMISEVDGFYLTIPHETDMIKIPTALIEGGLDEEAEAILANLMRMSAGTGGRTPHLYKIATTGFAIGMTEDEVIEEALWWNERHASPCHDDTYVVEMITKIGRNYGN